MGDLAAPPSRPAGHAPDLAYPEQKLLSMARIFASDAEVLLLDEPTSGFKTDSFRRVIPIVRRLVEHGNTVLLIEHNMSSSRSSPTRSRSSSRATCSPAARRRRSRMTRR